MLRYSALKMGGMAGDHRLMPQRPVETAHFGTLILQFPALP